jgi:hypothetical protein
MNIEASSLAEFGDHDAFTDFLCQNEIAHFTFARVLSEKLNQIISTPAPAGDPMHSENWLLDHWQRHVDECQNLGISVPDLFSYDLKQEGDFYDWMDLHSSLHTLQNAALGITS